MVAKPAPKNALRFISDSMGGHSYTVADGFSKNHGFAAELLGFWQGLRKACPAVLASLTGQNYLARLSDWGHNLSDVERIITDHGQEAEDSEPGHSLGEIQAGEVELIAEEAAND